MFNIFETDEVDRFDRAKIVAMVTIMSIVIKSTHAIVRRSPHYKTETFHTNWIVTGLATHQEFHTTFRRAKIIGCIWGARMDWSKGKTLAESRYVKAH